MNYETFLDAKLHTGLDHGFDPVWMPKNLFPFQESLIEWSCRKGRAAVFADCGLGKTAMQLTWAENVARITNGKVLILTPLAVAFQTVNEGKKFGIEVTHRREVVLTPFAGVGSEVYGAVLNGRRAIGIELKPSYYRQAVKNMEQCKPESETVDLFHETDK